MSRPDVLRFTVRGVPVPKARARVVTANGRTHSYTPDRTAAWEGEIVRAFRAAYPGWEPIPRGVAIKVTAEFVCPGRGSAASIRGDWDNFAKSLDALNGVAWDDDIQIVEARVRKRRAKRGEFPGVIVVIELASPE